MGVRGGDGNTGSGRTKMAVSRSNDACIAWRKCAWKTAATFLHNLPHYCSNIFLFASLGLISQEPCFIKPRPKYRYTFTVKARTQLLASHFVPYNEFA